MRDLNRLTECAIAVATKAGEIILEIYEQTQQCKIQVKDDNSPLTQADLMANEYILTELQKFAPEIPVLTEEGKIIPFTTRQSWPRYWLVDPLDGTREFIRHSGEFTVNIALIERHEPVIGVIHVPVVNETYFAWRGNGVRKIVNGQLITKPLQVRVWQKDQTIIFASKGAKEEKMQAFLGHLGIQEIKRVSSAWKFGLIAEGKGDIYPRLGDTCEWDNAAGQCILEEAGGLMIDLQGRPFRYNLRDSLINPYFMALGDKNALLPELKHLFCATISSRGETNG